jgi:hypothetical protein
MEGLGVIYLALGRLTFAQMCMLSIASLRRSGYRGPISIFTDLPHEDWIRMEILFRGLGDLEYSVRRLIPPEEASEEEQVRWRKTSKTRLNRLTPFRRTLYLDCDTTVCRRLNPVWKFIDGAKCPIAMARDRAPTVGMVRRLAPEWGDSSDWEETLALCGEEATHYNSGVIYWEDDDAVDELFRQWEEQMKKCSVIDQCPLVRAIHLSDMPPLVLPAVVNVQTLQSKLYERAVIRHYSGMNTAEALNEMLRAYGASMSGRELPGHRTAGVFCDKPYEVFDMPHNDEGEM